MNEAKPIIEYREVRPGLLVPIGYVARLYASGRTGIEGIGIAPEMRHIDDGHIDGKILQELSILPVKVHSLAERLVKAGFLNFDEVYVNLYEDWKIDVNLDYEGISKHVWFCGKFPPSSLKFKKILKEISDLLGVSLKIADA